MTKDEVTLRRLFSDARSQNGWSSDPVGDDELKAAYEIASLGPTSMNTQPMRLVFLRSVEAKERLKPALAATNVSKVMSAPVVALIAHDLAFADRLAEVFPHKPDAKTLFEGKQGLIDVTAFRNGTLQAAFLIIALRAVGLDVGPMSGFDPDKVNAEFFEGSTLRINFICGIGHGDPAKVFGRLPRLAFDDVARSL